MDFHAWENKNVSNVSIRQFHMHEFLLPDAIYINNLYMTTISCSRYPNFLGSVLLLVLTKGTGGPERAGHCPRLPCQLPGWRTGPAGCNAGSTAVIQEQVILKKRAVVSPYNLHDDQQMFSCILGHSYTSTKFIYSADTYTATLGSW